MAKKTRSVFPPEPEDTEPTLQRTIRPELLAELARPATLELLKGPGAPQTFPLLDGTLSVGRGRDADIYVASAELSRRHAALTHRDSEWTVQDLDSRNGVFLNGVKVHSASLRDGDKVQLGEVVFVFRERR
jgi:pSer/pThr/pTyr-binding forkhead associated (FHA) protein